MNIGSKNKKRVVLLSRPELPNVDQILEDISKAAPDDPVFNVLEKTGKGDEVEHRFLQCRRYLELNERLREAQGQLQRQWEELLAVGEQLDRKVEEIKGQLL
uniref:Si:ch73-238c9.1 n=1 Tax=Nothobranchius furzeri TaxID=105023 RepID=A0A8C6PXT5_NOTFU